mmetsp:Transcript_3028/g.2512  ORF Transcript_3028/g.2512 Transcript_3028/m.2512 type:complete len:111 (+) Transcript_3028:310-642(+)
MATSTEIFGVKIMPNYNENSPVFTPPVYDKRLKKFLHPFFHPEENKFYGPISCKLCKGLGYKKNNSPCETCYSYLCHKCWNTGIDVVKKKACKKDKCPYSTLYQDFVKSL